MDIHADITAKAEELRLALHAKMGVRGKSFSRAIHKAGYLLPRNLRKQAAVIVEAQKVSSHPKMVAMVDMQAVSTAYADITAYLAAIDPKEQQRTRLLKWLGRIAFNLIVIATCFVIWLQWAGHL